ncbi:Rha family transcriptional regulator [Wielerella bovis]|uniref:Rha family transcriptional regulator n=1 Tax=Wielerella bovis TaxID=2917790 RepID=UPI002019E0C5|nr:Rha family transcriptional regulator [Wielerella bovis]ULJ67469.1 Rha family transcriptional regulator [Wielerella bovis]
MNALTQYIQTSNNQVTTTSEFIAQAFGKQHKNVLAKIEEIAKEIKADFFELNFKPKAKQVKTGSIFNFNQSALADFFIDKIGAADYDYFVA